MKYILFFKNSFNELKKIIWPSFYEVVKITFIILIFVFFMSLYFNIIEKILKYFFSFIF